jgi:hypothetical protein
MISGVIGFMNRTAVTAIYSTASLVSEGSGYTGLVGWSGTGSSLSYSYFAGTFTSAFGNSARPLDDGRIATSTNNYYSSNAMAVVSQPVLGTGATLSQLKCTTSANDSTCAPGTVLFKDWDKAKDAQGNAYWNFGTSSDLPQLVMRPVFALRHSGGSCIHPSGGSPTPYNWTQAVLWPECDIKQPRLTYVHLTNGSLKHISSGKCLHPSGGSATPASGTNIVFWNICSDGRAADAAGNKRLAFEFTANGSIRHKNSGLCIHPSGDSASPTAGTALVLANGCDTPALNFTKLLVPAPPPPSACSVLGKAGKLYANVYLGGSSGSEASGRATASAITYCEPCGITSNTSGGTLNLYCAKQ